MTVKPATIRIIARGSPPSFKLKAVKKPTLRGRLDARFPASVIALSPIQLDRTGGNYTFSLDVNEIIENLPPGGVASVFGRTGDVAAQSGDYTFAQIGSTPTTLSGYGITDGVTLTGAEVLTNKNLASGTNTFPTFNQNTTGSAAKLTTARNIDGQAFDGTANITVIAPGTHAATGKTTPIDADELPLVDTAASNVLKKLTWANLKATLAAWLVSAGLIRERLTASRTYYVRTDGSDSNNGLANTSGGAFLTLQKAVDVIVGTLDLAGYSVTVQVADGTYTGAAIFSGPWTGGGTVTIQGNNSTPGNVIISTTSVGCFTNNGVLPGALNIRDMELRTTTSGSGINNAGTGYIGFQNINFGSCATAHVITNAKGSKVQATGSYAINGGAGYHMLSLRGEIDISARTVTLTGTPAFSSAFAFASRLGYVGAEANTFSGSATGTRYSVSSNAVIYTGGGGATYLPGNASGSTATGGLYT